MQQPKHIYKRLYIKAYLESIFTNASQLWHAAVYVLYVFYMFYIYPLLSLHMFYYATRHCEKPHGCSVKWINDLIYILHLARDCSIPAVIYLRTATLHKNKYRDCNASLLVCKKLQRSNVVYVSRDSNAPT